MLDEQANDGKQGGYTMEFFMTINNAVSNFVWGPIMLCLLVGTGLYMSSRTGFLQFRKFGFVLKHTIGGVFTGQQRDSAGNNISPFQAVSTALASTIGTGNIVGIATAIGIGGPGAIFWMWVSALLGMMTKYSEIVLAVKYRETNRDGQYIGGPMYYLKNGVGEKWPKVGAALGAMFALFAAIACVGTGNMTQSNSIANAFASTFGLNRTVIGIILCVIVAVVILGGIQSIAKITELLVPSMATFYLIFGIIVIGLNIEHVPIAFESIFKGAFAPSSVLGGAAGATIMTVIRMGIARGVFSNEAGLGSAPIAHAASSTKIPVQQGMWGIFEVFTTIIVCTMTAMIILTVEDPTTGQFLWVGGQYDGAALTLKAFEYGMPGKLGSIGLTFALAMFALSTLFGWCYYGEKTWEYLFRKNETLQKGVTIGYRVLYVGATYLGAVGGLQVIWSIADTFNGLMAIPNLVGVLLLSGIVLKETKEYFVSRNK